MVTGGTHQITWIPLLGERHVDVEGWGAGEVCELREGESFVLALQTMTNPDRWSVAGNEQEYLREYGVLDDLGDRGRHAFWQACPRSTLALALDPGPGPGPSPGPVAGSTRPPGSTKALTGCSRTAS